MQPDDRLHEVRVLIVDDERDQAEMYQCGLEDAGYCVLAASTGARAVADARTLSPDVIVLDLRLPDMSGWDVCAALKHDPRTEAIPIVILTAAVTPTLARDAADAGCAMHLLKPCVPDELTRVVRRVLAAA